MQIPAKPWLRRMPGRSSTARGIAAASAVALLLVTGGAAATAQPTTGADVPNQSEADSQYSAPSANACGPIALSTTPAATETTIPVPTSTPSTTPSTRECVTQTAVEETTEPPSQPLPSEAPASSTSTSSPVAPSAVEPAPSAIPSVAETITADRLTPAEAEQATSVIESLTGTDELVAGDALPLYLPKAELRAAVLATNQIGGLLYYNVPETSNIDTPTTSAHTVLFTSDDGSADAFQATSVGQVRQALVIPGQVQRIERMIQLNGGISLAKTSNEQYTVFDDQQRPVGYIDNLRVRTATGEQVPASITVDQNRLLIDLQDVSQAPVYATWSFAPGSNAAEVVLE